MIIELNRDIRNDSGAFGDKFVIHRENFRQILSVLKYSSPLKIINITLNGKLLKCKQLK